jgi:hypothetical protein
VLSHVSRHLITGSKIVFAEVGRVFNEFADTSRRRSATNRSKSALLDRVLRR